PGQVDVHHDQVGVQRRGQADGLFARGCLADDIEAIQEVEHHLGCLAERRLIVDDQDAYRGVAHGAAVPRLSWFARKRSTAFTRRCTACSSLSPSLVNTDVMCFSTARSLSTSDSAIAALFFPCAISASVSRSRTVRVAT